MSKSIHRLTCNTVIKAITNSQRNFEQETSKNTMPMQINICKYFFSVCLLKFFESEIFDSMHVSLFLLIFNDTIYLVKYCCYSMKYMNFKTKAFFCGISIGVILNWILWITWKILRNKHSIAKKQEELRKQSAPQNGSCISILILQTKCAQNISNISVSMAQC